MLNLEIIVIICKMIDKKYCIIKTKLFSKVIPSIIKKHMKSFSNYTNRILGNKCIYTAYHKYIDEFSKDINISYNMTKFTHKTR